MFSEIKFVFDEPLSLLTDIGKDSVSYGLFEGKILLSIKFFNYNNIDLFPF